MDEETVIYKIQRSLKESYQQIGDAMIGGAIDNMEKYKYMMGQAHAYLKISQDISNLLKKKEQDETKYDFLGMLFYTGSPTLAWSQF